jgi:hypothetical protein
MSLLMSLLRLSPFSDLPTTDDTTKGSPMKTFTRFKAAAESARTGTHDPLRAAGGLRSRPSV